MAGNYRPRRRHGPSRSPKAPAASESTAGQAAEASAGRDASPEAAGAKRGTGRAGGAAPPEATAKRGTPRRAGSPRPPDPRRTAYDVLAAVRDREAYANLLLPRLLADRRLAGRDAALTTELAYGTLRGQGTYDAVLATCSDRPLDKLDPPVLDVLRLGAHQLLRTRVGAHAAVATSVDLARSVAGPRVSGYVNAVLRRVATRDLDTWLGIVAPDAETDPDGNLATRYSHPRWIIAAYRAALGESAASPFSPPGLAGAAAELAGEETAPGPPVTELEAALAAGNARPRVTLAAFPAGPPRDEIMPADAVPGRWSPYAFTLASGDPAPLTASGAAAVQDEGSQLAAIALSRAPVTAGPASAGPASAGPAGERWLDMCAGPGGKARLLYGLAAQRGARLTAAELHPHRAALVRDALTAAGRNIAGEPSAFEVLVADSTKPPWPEGTFDRVLVDVPCTGLGALRRRPEARWRKTKADLAELTALQRALLRSALAAVRPGGVVAYVTCSPVTAETSAVVIDVVASRPGTELLDATAALPGIPGARAANPLFAQLWPHRHGTDAIFIALLRRAQA
jgi:16S rRNA (cytosine967-C5)-methyltransferase